MESYNTLLRMLSLFKYPYSPLNLRMEMQKSPLVPNPGTSCALVGYRLYVPPIPTLMRTMSNSLIAILPSISVGSSKHFIMVKSVRYVEIVCAVIS